MKVETVKVSVLRVLPEKTYEAAVCGHVLPEVHVHLAPAFPNGYLIENVPRSAGILKAMPAVENGCLVAPKLPGLGLELNEEAVRRFTYTD